MIRYTPSLEGVEAGDLDGGFFEDWPSPPDAATHLRILRGSRYVMLACDQSTEAVVGFATAIGDGVLTAYIPLLEVLPAYRNRGIGSELVRRIADEIGPLYAIDAMCDPELAPFYRHLGMRSGHGVMLRRYDLQPGRPDSDRS